MDDLACQKEPVDALQWSSFDYRTQQPVSQTWFESGSPETARKAGVDDSSCDASMVAPEWFDVESPKLLKKSGWGNLACPTQVHEEAPQQQLEASLALSGVNQVEPRAENQAKSNQEDVCSTPGDAGSHGPRLQGNSEHMTTSKENVHSTTDNALINSKRTAGSSRPAQACMARTPRESSTERLLLRIMQHKHISSDFRESVSTMYGSLTKSKTARYDQETETGRKAMW
jgi:hypothetical protein